MCNEVESGGATAASGAVMLLSERDIFFLSGYGQHERAIYRRKRGTIKKGKMGEE
jgi:hypothetical protein